MKHFFFSHIYQSLWINRLRSLGGRLNLSEERKNSDIFFLQKVQRRSKEALGWVLFFKTLQVVLDNTLRLVRMVFYSGPRSQLVMRSHKRAYYRLTGLLCYSFYGPETIRWWYSVTGKSFSRPGHVYPNNCFTYNFVLCLQCHLCRYKHIFMLIFYASYYVMLAGLRQATESTAYNHKHPDKHRTGN